jgi:hypothetical protein
MAFTAATTPAPSPPKPALPNPASAASIFVGIGDGPN